MVAKAEVHCHIEGAAPPDLVRQLAWGQDLAIDHIFDDQGGYRWHDFTSFLATYDAASAVFRSGDAYARLAYTYLMALARDGAIYSELFLSPDHGERFGCPYAEMLDGIARGVERAEAETGIVARLIPTCLRHLGPDHAVETARLVVAEPHPLVTGFGMGGDERMHHPGDFRPAFAIAADAGLACTVHAGEFGGPDSIRAALDHLPVGRIGHGVRAIEAPALVECLAREAIVLEVCPGSNVALGLYDSLAAHPVNALRAAGVPVTLNSDDPPYFHTSLKAEYDGVAAAFGWSDDDLIDVTRTAITAAFVDDETRARLFDRLNENPQ